MFRHDCLCETLFIGTTTEIQFSYSLPLKLHSYTVQAYQAYCIDSQVCFHRQLFLSLSNYEGALLVPWSHWMALIRVCVVPNCSQRLSWLVLWNCHLLNTQHGCLCLNGGLNLPLTAHPPHHPYHPLIRAMHVITVAVKNAAENPAALAS